MEVYIIIKNNEIICRPMDELEVIKLSEVSQPHKDKYHICEFQGENEGMKVK
jgi:hypothetical protein